MRSTAGAALRRSLCLLLLYWVLAPGFALGAIVAIVTDLTGKGRNLEGGEPRDLTILAQLASGAVVELDASATLVVLYLDASDEYVFEGPARITFGPARPTADRGVPPEKRALPPGKDGQRLRIKPLGVTQAGIILRGPPDANPSADLRAQVEALRPPDGAPLSTRVAYALWLEEVGLKGEARPYWKRASAERAADARLRLAAD